MDLRASQCQNWWNFQKAAYTSAQSSKFSSGFVSYCLLTNLLFVSYNSFWKWPTTKMLLLLTKICHYIAVYNKILCNFSQRKWMNITNHIKEN